MSEPQRFAPTPTPETEHFWEGCRAGELRLQRCGACDHVRFPPQAFCPRCASDNTEVFVASGRGRLASYVIAQRPMPGWEAPYVIALVTLAEGPRLLTNLVGCEPSPEALPVGLAVQVDFEARGEQAVPVFRPVDDAGDPVAPPEATTNLAVPDERPLPPTAPPVTQRRGAVTIVGAAETTELGKISHLTPLGLHTDAARNALADAGYDAAEIDGVACAGVSPLEVAFRLGITPTWVDGTSVGGCSFMLHVRHAVAAIEAGLATTVLITHGESGRSGVGGPPGRRRSELMEQFELPFGVAGPPTLFTLPALAWMRRYDIPEEDLASVAVAQRRWAAMQPRALRREPLSVDEVLDSPMIAWPFRRHMCCLVTDGGGALVLTAADRAGDRPQPPVHVLGTGEGVDAPLVSQMSELTSSRAFRVAGRRALGEAGITTADVDHLMAYDAFAHTPCYALEALGFTGPGESAAFVAEGNTSPGGSLPMNTNGGGLSYTHTGMYGMFAIQESVRQVRGTSPAQVDGVEISVAHGVGGMFSASGTLVLGSQQP